MKRLVLILVVLFISTNAIADRVHPEKYYQNIYASNLDGQMEVVFSDRSRCDIVTSTHAIEVDYASKYKEAITQSLHYSNMSGKRAGIILIDEKGLDSHYIDSAKKDIKVNHLPIDVLDNKITEKHSLRANLNMPQLPSKMSASLTTVSHPSNESIKNLRAINILNASLERGRKKYNLKIPIKLSPRDVGYYPMGIDKDSVIWKEFKESRYYDSGIQMSTRERCNNWYWFKANRPQNSKLIIPTRTFQKTIGFYVNEKPIGMHYK